MALIGTGLIYENISVLFLPIMFYSMGFSLILFLHLIKPAQIYIKGKIAEKAPPTKQQWEFTLRDENNKIYPLVIKEVYQKTKIGDEILLCYEKSITDNCYLTDVFDREGQPMILFRDRLDRIKRRYRLIHQILLSISVLIVLICLIFLIQNISK
ncbi:MAG: hypothetical protein B6244_11990 [Candidatus Cloacimonetes bacterium 4572_55]|nr:MAG: hypothetical protein B6244_11990 [Candidatus Cloacimonetes bacterium 4572_55]